MIYPGENYSNARDISTWTLNPAVPEHFERFFADLAEAKVEAPAINGIIHLWSVDAPSSETLTPSLLEQAQLFGCGSVLHLLQALSKQENIDSPSLWLITRGAISVDESPGLLSVAQAPLWGLGKVIALEHPDFWGGLIDLDPQAFDDEADWLLAEFFRFRRRGPDCLSTKETLCRQANAERAPAILMAYHSAQTTQPI